MKLTENEKLIIKFYRECEGVDFYKHNCKNFDDIKKLAEELGGEAEVGEREGTTWRTIEKKLGKKNVRFTHFLE